MNLEQLVAAASMLDAKTVETLIADLMDLRASMNPPVSDQPPIPGSGGSMALQNDPSIATIGLHGGRVRLLIQNAGIGWLAFDLSRRNSAALRDFLTGHVDATPSDLFSMDGIDAPKH